VFGAEIYQITFELRQTARSIATGEPAAEMEHLGKMDPAHCVAYAFPGTAARGLQSKWLVPQRLAEDIAADRTHRAGDQLASPEKSPISMRNSTAWWLEFHRICRECARS
jgi:hypothetical protein